MKIRDAKDFGAAIRGRRTAQNLRQKDLAGVCHTGLRFISDLEGGKPTCRLGLALKVARAVGLKVVLKEPRAKGAGT